MRRIDRLTITIRRVPNSIAARQLFMSSPICSWCTSAFRRVRLGTDLFPLKNNAMEDVLAAMRANRMPVPELAR